MDSFNLSKIHDKIVEAIEMVRNKDKELSKLLDEAEIMIADMQYSVREENENLEYLGIYSDNINKTIKKCEAALKAVGYDDDEISQYHDIIKDSVNTHMPEEIKDDKNVTYVIAKEYLDGAEEKLENAFEAVGLEIKIDYDISNGITNLYIGDNEFKGNGDTDIIYKAVADAIREKLSDGLENLEIDSEVLNNIECTDMKGTIENAVHYIVQAVNEKYGTDFEYEVHDNDYIEIASESIGRVEYMAGNIGDFSKILNEIGRDYQLEKPQERTAE